MDDLSEGSEVFHNDIRSRFDRGEPEIIGAMHFWAGLADQARDLLIAGRGSEIKPLLDANFDRRRSLYRISEGNLQMVETARHYGASAKFTGSGGAIVGTYEGESMFEELRRAFAPMKVKIFKPKIVNGV
jgi:glucuronokinase